MPPIQMQKEQDFAPDSAAGSKKEQIEPWMDKVLRQRAGEIPPEIRERLGNRRIRAAAADILKKTSEWKTEKVFGVFCSFLRNPSFQEGWINDYWSQMLARILKHENPWPVCSYVKWLLDTNVHPSRINSLLEKGIDVYNEKTSHDLIALQKLKPISEFSGNPMIVWQGQGAIMGKDSQAHGLYTFHLGNCSAAICVSKDASKPLAGLAHIDPLMSRESIRSFFGKFSEAGRVEVSILGGEGESSRRIKEIAESFPNISVSVFSYDFIFRHDAFAVDRQGNIYCGEIGPINTSSNLSAARSIDDARANSRNQGIEIIEIR